VKSPGAENIIPEDLAQAFFSPSPPAKCQYCGAAGAGEDGKPLFYEWHAFQIAWDQIRAGDPISFKASCWECGKTAKFIWRIRKIGIFSFEKHSGLYMWLFVALAVLFFPLLLLLSPLLLPGWLVWRKLTGKCLRCKHLLTCYSGMPMLKEDGRPATIIMTP